MKRKLTILLTALLLLTGLSSWGQTRTQINWVAADQGYTNGQVIDSVDFDDNVIGSFNKGTSSNPPKYYTTGTAIRCYGGNYFTITTSEGNLTEIDLSFASGEGTNAIITDVGSYEDGIWTGSSTSVTFTIDGTSGHRRITGFDITYSTESGQQTVATPMFSPANGTYFESQTVSITCSTDGATIRYTTDGNDPTESSLQYTVPLNISTNTTLKAKAFKSGYTASSIATAIYTFPVPITIAQAKALALNEYALVQGVVTFIDNRNVYVQDETGGICLFLNSDTVPSNLAIGDMVQAYGKRANYNGLYELSSINGDNVNEFTILSTGNALPLVVKTISEVLASGDNELQCTRVKIEGAVIGAINTSGNTPLTQGENSINIYKVPELTGIEEGNIVDVIGVVGYFNVPQIRVALASDITLSSSLVNPVLTATPMTLSGMTYNYDEGGPSEITYFEFAGNNLVGPAYVYPSESFEVSSMSDELFHAENPVTIYSTGNFAGVNIYIRLKAGLETGTYSEQLTAVSEGAETLYINVSGTVNGGIPTPPDPPTPPTPGDGNYVRISDLSNLTVGSYVIMAARFDENTTDYYAMSNASSGKPTGVLFTSATADENEVLPGSIVDEEENYYWIVGLTDNGYTFTNAIGELIGYTSSTNFSTGGDNTEWGIALQVSEEGAMVPNYTGFVISNVNNPLRAIALNSNHNFGPYHTQNMNGNGYNFYLDLFVKTEGGVPPTPTVATPTFTPGAGIYFEEQTVSIACATAGATIYYSTVSENGPWAAYTEAITVDESMALWAYAEKEGYNDSPVTSATYTIQLGVVTIFNQDWEGEMNGWTFVNVEGEMSWTIAQYGGNHYAYANGYNHGANIDWCISPAFNLNTISNPVLTFRTAKNYTGPTLEIFFSNDYDGSNPLTSTWTALDCILSTGGWAWTESGDIDLSSFNGSNCYIGFMYTCEDGSAAGWELDDILLVGQTSEPAVNVTPLALTGFTYIEGEGPSAEQSFTISGFNLSSNIIVTPSTNYEISQTSGSGFTQNPITLAPVGGNVEDVTIYVRLISGLAVGNYNQNIAVSCADIDEIQIACSGNVTPQSVIGDDYVRISNMSELASGNRIVFAARFDENATDYYAMSNAASGKPTGVLFTSTTSDGNEILPASILAEEDNFYWTVNVTADGYTFTNANGDMIGYTSSTNFSPNGDNTVWSIEIGTSEETAMVPNYTGFVIANVNNAVRAFALNNNHNFGPYHTQNMAGENYNFFLDIFMQGESGGTPIVATPTFTPAAGTYYEPQTVSIACSTNGVTIHYTLDGTNPNESSPVYTTPLTIETTTTVKAIAMKEGYNSSNIAEATYTIQVGVVTIFSQDWEGEMNGWTFVTVEGNKPWNVSQNQGNHYAYANGYNGGVNEQWCISPGFNIHNYENVMLSFRNAKNYTGPNLELKYSTNYDGVDPTTASWWTFDFNMSPGSYTWVESGDIPISIYPYPAHDCYIAFKYTSTETEAAAWEVDDIILTGSTSVPNLTVTPSSLSGFTHVVGEGPSESQYFTLSGVNIGPAPGGGSTGSVIIQSSENEFEVSLDNETFSWQVYIDGINGTLPPTPVYVRMNGAEVGQYSGTVEIHASSSDQVTVTLNGTVTEPPVPGDDYVRISDMGELVDGNRIVFAARFDEIANAYYAMRNTASGKPEGVLFTSTTNEGNEILPASILDEEDNFYWTVNVTADGYTFTNAAGDMIGYTSSTNFSPNGDNTAWSIEISTSEETAMVPNYTGFVIANVNNPVRAFALNGNHNFGPYHTQNIAGENYNFFLDIFMQGEGGTPTVAAPTFDPAGGTYYEPQEVTISCATEGATIWYSTITGNGPWTPYIEPIIVEEFASIWAYASKEGYNDSPVVHADYIIQDNLVIIFNQDWEDGWQGWTEVCEMGDSLWHIGSYQGNHYAYANGYNHEASVDWLISPAFDLDSYSDVVLTFRTAMNYNGPDLEVLFSNDYDGQNPTITTWEPLSYELSQGSWNWVESTISLDEFNGSNCYIAFKYTCTDDAAGWEVDDIILVSGNATSTPTLTATPNSLSGFSYVVGNGPSASQSYTLTGANLVGEGEITIYSCSCFEISLDDETFGEALFIPYADGVITNQPVTIYVRMIEGLSVGTYEGVYILNEYYAGNNYAIAQVQLSGTVHSENEPMMSAWMPLYIQGNNGSNNNRVPVAVHVLFTNLYPNTTYHYTNQFVDENDGPETAGAGNVIYVSEDGFYRNTNPSLATLGGYGEFTTDGEGLASVWLMNEPTANTRFTPGNHVYMRVRLNDGNDGTTVEQIFTSEDYATVLNFGTENDENSGSAFYVKSNEAAMTFAMLFDTDMDVRPVYSTSIETTGVDYSNINQYADFYKEFVAGNDGWFGGILPNVNENGINYITIWDMAGFLQNQYLSENGHWNPNANTVNPTNGLNEPIFIDLTDDGVDDNVDANVKVWSTDHVFVVENGNDARYTMNVVNMLGQNLMSEEIAANSTIRINHNLIPGIYVISLQNSQKQVSVKVMVQ